MTLLNDAIEASGGLAKWNRLKRFTLQLSIAGELVAGADRSPRFKEIVAEGSTRRQLVRLTGFADPGVCGVYRPDRVDIENADGNVLRTWRAAHPIFRPRASDGLVDEMQLVFMCGLSIWRDLTSPFVLAHPDVTTEELSPWAEQGQVWRRMRATLPKRFGAHEQTFYFDSSGLQRRTDRDLYGVRVADYSWAHQEFGGIVLATLRRSLGLAADGTVAAKPSLFDVEIFDAEFE
jgi:hypothetical protein